MNSFQDSVKAKMPAEMSPGTASGRIRVRKLALDFAPSLVPIAIVYNVTHYYTLLLMQVSKLGRVATDPFGFDGTSSVSASRSRRRCSTWDLFGIRRSLWS